MARLTSTDDLRRIIAEPRAATRSKILDALDEQSLEFLKRCPFALVSTSSADGTLEVSPKGDEPGFIRVEDSRTLLIIALRVGAGAELAAQIDAGVEGAYTTRLWSNT
ncbi:hypothetical protein BH11PSE3_BH11PSE3_23470 [soil metagenome]